MYPAASEFESGAGSPSTKGDVIRIVCRTALDGLFVVDDARRFRCVNGPGAELLRVRESELLKSRMDDFSPPEHLWILDDLWAMFERERTQQGRYEVLRGDGSRRLIEYRASWGFEDGRHLIAARGVVGRGTVEARHWQERVGDELSPREVEVLQLVADGNTAPEIGNVLSVTPGTVKTHLRNIYDKLGARDRGSAVARGIRRGLIQ